MELATLDGPEAAGDLEQSLHAAARWTEKADALIAELARAHTIHILAPSGPVFDGGERPVNRAAFFGPDGAAGRSGQAGDDPLRARGVGRGARRAAQGLRHALGRIGVLICYDAEFPLLGRALMEAGVEILLVPVLHRGAVGLLARARRRHGPRAGGAVRRRPFACGGPGGWSPAVDLNTGAAAIYGPPDLGFPATGVLAEGALNAPGWVTAELDRAAIARVRRDGAVLGHAHWPESARRGSGFARIDRIPLKTGRVARI
jgi:predicted amidohydrolase